MKAARVLHEEYLTRVEQCRTDPYRDYPTSLRPDFVNTNKRIKEIAAARKREAAEAAKPAAATSGDVPLADAKDLCQSV